MDIELIRVDEKAKAEDPFLVVQRQLMLNIQYIDHMYRFPQGYKPKYNYQAAAYSSIKGIDPMCYIYDEINKAKPENESMWRKFVEGIRSGFQ